MLAFEIGPSFPSFLASVLDYSRLQAGRAAPGGSIRTGIGAKGVARNTDTLPMKNTGAQELDTTLAAGVLIAAIKLVVGKLRRTRPTTSILLPMQSCHCLPILVVPGSLSAIVLGFPGPPLVGNLSHHRLEELDDGIGLALNFTTGVSRNCEDLWLGFPPVEVNPNFVSINGASAQRPTPVRASLIVTLSIKAADNATRLVTTNGDSRLGLTLGGRRFRFFEQNEPPISLPPISSAATRLRGGF
ncbi:MAG: hypothetical protein JO105_18450 [Hyphomicrobiales bacterium]|nr:hypothetical protein [Hyphomicrobiales bacterium]